MNSKPVPPGFPRFKTKKAVKKSRRRPRKQTVRRATRDRCDEAFSKLVRQVGHCENCGSTERLQCAHGWTRGYAATRWLRANAFCLCASCHMYFTYRPIAWDDWMRERMGDELYEEVRALAPQQFKADYEAILAELEAK